MNPFIKSAVLSGTQLADKVIKRVETAQLDQQNNAQRQQAQMEQTQLEQAQQEQVQQEQAQKQQQQEHKQQAQQTQQQTNALVQANNTPSYKPYIMKQARGLGGFLSKLMSNKSRAGKVVGEGALTLGSGAGNAYLWDQMVYDDPMFGEGGVTDDKVRGFGAGLAGLTGMLVPRSVYRGFKDKGLFGGAKSGLITGGALPAAERGASIALFDMLPTAAEAQDIKLKNLKDQAAGKNDVDNSDAWKWLAGAGLGLASIPALAYAYKSLRDKDETEPDRRDRDRVALEIPSYKISDSLYNSLGREILFKDKKEEEREKKANMRKQANMASFDDLDELVKDRKENGILKESADDLPDGTIKAIRYGYTIELENGNTYPTKDGVRNTRKYAGAPREYIIEDGKIFETFDKQANMAMTPEQARENLSPRGFNMWIKDYHRPSGTWNMVESFAPMVSGLLGGPQLGNFQQRLTQHLVPLESGKVLPRVENEWSKTLAYKDQPRVQWTPGQEFNLTPEHGV